MAFRRLGRSASRRRQRLLAGCGSDASGSAILRWSYRRDYVAAAVMQHLGIDDIDDIMHRVYVTRLTRSEIAAMARLVLDAARDGDAVATT